MARILEHWRAGFRASRWAMLALLGLGLLLGAIGLAGFAVVVESSSTLGFCTSCHEMRAFVYEEYRQTHHFSNRTGVRAECADCHVPKPPLAKLARKIRATFTEVPAHFLGRIDTEEKFEAHRLVLAERVWAEMKANDSRECRSCHDREAMVLDKQRPRSRAQHESALTTGETCIDCHKGIAHKKPESPDQADDEEDEADFTL
ncbi:MAG TPA: Denitrification system component NirT [Xanthomonadales bacterium]|nr:Denitrification system component NirT [Xanthomonadales bacterium]